MDIKNALVVYAKPYTKEQKLSFYTVSEVLDKSKINAKLIEKTKLVKEDFVQKGVVITVGGDGTFLRAAQFIKNSVPIIGINSDTKSKEGFYMRCNRFDFKEKFQRLMNGNYKISKLLRLEAKINNKAIDELALNEFYFGASKAYMTSRYKIKVGSVSESQRSSGIIIATPTGSRAWSKAVGLKPLPSHYKAFGFVVREPFEHNIFSNYKLKQGVLDKNKKIIIKSEMQNGILVADSVSREYHFKYGDKINIGVSNKGISLIEV